MLTILEAIQVQLAECGVELSDKSLNILLVNGNLGDGSEPYTLENKVLVDMGILSRLERLAVVPDVTEGGLALKWDRTAVATYCEQLRTELGQSDSTTSFVCDASNRW